MQQVEFGNWNVMKWQSTRPGARRVLVGTEAKDVTVAINELSFGCEARPHSHEHEQISVILSGSCTYFIEGAPYELTEGSWIYTPPRMNHYSVVTSQEKPLVILDIFAPAREDFVASFREFTHKE